MTGPYAAPESPLNSRFQWSPYPMAAPAKCCVCGAVNRAVVDLNFNIRGYGAVYFCVTCVEEMATVMGWVPKAKLTAIQDHINQDVTDTMLQSDRTAVDNELIERTIMALSAILDGFISLRYIPDAMVVVEDDSDKSSNDRALESVEQGAVRGTEQDDNSAVGEGPVSVSSDSKSRSTFDLDL